MNEIENKENQIEEIKDNNKKSNYNILTLILGFAVIMMAFSIYWFGSFDGISEDELKNKFIKKDNISFDNIKQSEKENYISKDKYLSEIQKIKNENVKEVEKIVYKDKIIKTEPKIVEKVVEKIVYKDKIIEIEKIVELTKNRDINKSNFNIFRCYGMAPSGYRLSSNCKSNLKYFLRENSDSEYFEIIAVMNESDFRTLMILKEKQELLKEIDLSVKQISKLEKITNIGLDKLRVIETMWEVKKILGNNTIVVPVSYNVNSKKNRGTIIRAYKN